MRLLKRWRTLATGAVVIALVVVALWPATMAVDVAMVTRGPLRVTLDEEGETRVRERFVISAPVTGRLARIDLEPGDEVARDATVVARLLPAPPGLLDARTSAELSAAVSGAEAALGQARAERERAAATLARAESSQRRQQDLESAGLISRDEREAGDTAVKTAMEAVRAAEFQVSRAEHDLRMARARLQQTGASGRPIEIVSPVEGVVLRRHRESEAIVAAGEPLLDIGDPGHIEVVADLLSTDAVRVQPGARALIEQWGGDQPLEGRVRRVEPSGFMKVSALGVEEQRVNVLVDFGDPAAARALGDGYRVEVRIVMWEEADVLLVPTGAIFRSGTDWAAFVVADGMARLTTITIGQRAGTAAQVVDGLDAGQQVVLHPPDTLADGARVAVRD
ncbi:MAG: efflux RND transporter periplasmic adaptor subunit [Acidimicrobiia bacterium]|nr:efflux RND transporter periplasmic adaptor subunit [Acidimicrobiia bacterium]